MYEPLSFLLNELLFLLKKKKLFLASQGLARSAFWKWRFFRHKIQMQLIKWTTYMWTEFSCSLTLSLPFSSHRLLSYFLFVELLCFLLNFDISAHTATQNEQRRVREDAQNCLCGLAKATPRHGFSRIWRWQKVTVISEKGERNPRKEKKEK